MVDPVDTAHDQIDEAREEQGEAAAWPRRMAVTVSFLAAALAMAEVGAKSSQTAYLTHHIGASDIWAAYQAKNLRANMWDTRAAILESLPNANERAVQARIANARAEEARMKDESGASNGMKQLAEQAKEEEEQRAHSFHLYHGYEYTSGALEIAIVLASVSVVTRVRALGWVAGGIGLAACVYGLSVFGHLT